MKEIYEKYHFSGNLKCIVYFNENGDWHREGDLPAVQIWHGNGQLKTKAYRIHDELHNNSNSARVLFHENGKIWRKHYFLNNISMDKLRWLNHIKNI